MNRKSIVSIIGPGHCGSTLLDLILGGHSRIFGAGELLSLGMDKDYFLLKKPINLINGLDDRFWSKDFLRKLYPCYKDYYNLWYKLTYYVLPENPYSKNRSKLYHLLLERSRKNILIDSSKGHFWIRKSIYQILRDKEFNHY